MSPNGSSPAGCGPRLSGAEELQEIRRQNELLAGVLEHASQAFAVGFPDGRIGLVNRAFEQLTGYTAQELGNLDWSATLTPPEWRELERRKLEELHSSGRPVRYEKEYIRKDGTRVTVELLVHLARDAGGGPKYYYSFLTDVTERKRAQVELLRYELLARHTRDMVLFLRREDGQILEANAAAIDAYGYSRDELLTLTVRDLRAPDTRDVADSQMARADAQGILFETVHRRKDGSMFPVEVSSCGATIGGERTLVSVVRDITERRQSEETLRRNEEILRGILDATQESVCLFDTRGTLLMGNPTAIQRLGVATGEVIGRNCYEIFPAPVAAARLARIREAAETGNPVFFEDERGGINFHNSYYPVWEGDGSINRVVAFSRDITKLKQAERERETAVEFLRTINASRGLRDLIGMATAFFKQLSGCEAVGVRLKEGDDYPYLDPTGFSERFLSQENSLCARNDAGEVVRDASGDPVLACMCGNVICGRFEPGKPFYTPRGSYWCNSSAPQMAGATGDACPVPRTACLREGYESIALIAMRSGEETLGLLQLNDRRRDRFARKDIEFWERLGGYLAVAAAKARAEENLRASEERFRLLADQTVDGIFVSNPQGRYLDVNSAGAAMLGYTREEILNMSITDVIAPEDVPRIGPEVEEFGDGKVSRREWRFRRRDGSIFPGEIVGRQLPDGPLQVILRDITERRLAEAALRESEERLRLALDAAGLAAWDWDIPSGSVIWNDEHFRMMGYEPGAFQPTYRHWTDRVHPEDLPVAEAAIHFAMKQGDDYVSEFRSIWPDGTVRWLEARGQFVRDASGAAVRCYGVMLDMTERRKTEGALQRANADLHDTNAKLRSLGEKLQAANQELQASNLTLEERVAERTAELAHRTVQLQALAASLNRAEEGERRRIAQVIHDHLQQLLVGAHLSVDGLLARSRGLPVERDLEALTGLIAESIQVSRSLTAELCPSVLYREGLAAALRWLGGWFKEKHRLSVRVQTDQEAEVQEVETRIMLFRSVRELLFNVVKHAQTRSARVRLSRSDDSTVRIVVSDKGIGFDPAQVRAREGTENRFGLFSLRERMELVGGNLIVESEPGRGSRFTINAPLPVPQAEPPRAETPPRAAEAGFKPMAPVRTIRIVVVDDHAVVRDGLARALADEEDFEVVGQAATGMEAIEQVHRLNPDVVLMDVSMPKMDGIEATRKILAESPHIRIIGLSMYDDDSHSIAMRGAGAVDFLDKSGPAAGVVAAIRRHSRPGRKPARKARRKA